jgi:hypothetical protein
MCGRFGIKAQWNLYGDFSGFFPALQHRANAGRSGIIRNEGCTALKPKR